MLHKEPGRLLLVRWNVEILSQEFTIVRLRIIISIFVDYCNLMLSYYERHPIIMLPNTDAGAWRGIWVVCLLCDSILSHAKTVIFLFHNPQRFVERSNGII